MERTPLGPIRRWCDGIVTRVTWPLLLITVITELSLSMLFPLLAEVKTEFEITSGQATMVIASFGFARLLMNLPVGYLLERVDRLCILVGGTMVMSVGALIGATAPNVLVLVIGRALMGAGSAGAMTVIQYTLSRVSTVQTRGRMLGLHQAMVMLGMTVAPALGGVLGTVVDWRATLALSGVLIGIAAVPVLRLGSIFKEASSPAVPSPARASAPAGQPAHAAPTTRRPTRLVGGASAVFAINFAVFTFFFTGNGLQNSIIPLFGGLVLGMNPAAIGTVMGAAALLRLVLSIVAGDLADRYGRKRILVPGMATMGLGLAVFTIPAGVAGFVVAMMISSCGRLGNGIPSTMLVDQSPPNRLGRTMWINRMSLDSGAVIGPFVLGAVVDLAGYQAAIWCGAALALVSALLVQVLTPESGPIRPAPTPRVSVRESVS